ncbi:MAG: hypothetical protein Q8S11_11970 [Daejeonella sp.]|uniref:hypothetical protein n=1 Tax=Daejeonella sp. TaxID=2805397 RepID=UPI0027350FBF|nr:hypothetical protein [Daejeonella sp.]MDP3469046.1 hypothetical protein [Daejeonella sp.]
MMSNILFRKRVIMLIPLIFLSFSCTDYSLENQTGKTPEKVLKVRTTLPACCSNKPSRFPAKPGLKQALR